jgi:hypothetical protein
MKAGELITRPDPSMRCFKHMLGVLVLLVIVRKLSLTILFLADSIIISIVSSICVDLWLVVR